MNGRIIAIGDIHGCHLEFAELLDRLALTAGDRLVLLGDLINRGPSSAAVIDLALKHNALCVLGNHDIHYLEAKYWFDQGIAPPSLRYQRQRSYAAQKVAHWRDLERLL